MSQELESARRRIPAFEIPITQCETGLTDQQTVLHHLVHLRAAKLRQVLGRSRQRLRASRLGGRLAAARRWFRRAVSGEAPAAAPPPFDPFNELYQRWIAQNEPRPDEYNRQRRHRFQLMPVISLVVPVFNPPPRFLEAMIESVRRQTYSKWELCLADASTADWVRPMIERQARANSRIKVRFLAENRGIVGNSNAALELAGGEYIGLLDHDDALPPFALFEIAAAVERHADADLIYSDEDKLDEFERRRDPYFKPDWSPELLLSYNYVCHFMVLRRRLVEQIGGFRAGFDGAQDYDLVLRASEHARRVVHIPKVLYHWRMHAQSTAQDTNSKDYAVDAGRRAVADHLHRRGVAGAIERRAVPGLYRVCRTLKRKPFVSVIALSQGDADVVSRYEKLLEDCCYRPYELLIVPPTNADATSRLNVRTLPWASAYHAAKMANFAATQANGELLLFVHGVERAGHSDWLEEMAAWFEDGCVGAVGAKLCRPNGTVAHAGWVVHPDGVTALFAGKGRGDTDYGCWLGAVRNCAAVSADCLLVRRDTFALVGGFDETFVSSFHDADLCLRIRDAGQRIVWTPDAELVLAEPEHLQVPATSDLQLWQAKWGARLAAGDPCFSSNLAPDHTYCVPRV